MNALVYLTEKYQHMNLLVAVNTIVWSTKGKETQRATTVFYEDSAQTAHWSKWRAYKTIGHWLIQIHVVIGYTRYPTAQTNANVSHSLIWYLDCDFEVHSLYMWLVAIFRSFAFEVLLPSHGQTRRFAIQVLKLHHPDLKLAHRIILFFLCNESLFMIIIPIM